MAHELREYMIVVRFVRQQQRIRKLAGENRLFRVNAHSFFFRKSFSSQKSMTPGIRVKRNQVDIVFDDLVKIRQRLQHRQGFDCQIDKLCVTENFDTSVFSFNSQSVAPLTIVFEPTTNRREKLAFLQERKRKLEIVS